MGSINCSGKYAEWMLQWLPLAKDIYCHPFDSSKDEWILLACYVYSLRQCRDTHTHTHTYVRTYTHTHTYIYTYVCTKKWKNRSDVNTRKKSRQLLEDLNETRGYWTLKEEVLERTLWRTRFGGGYGPVVGQTAEWTNSYAHVRMYTHTDER